MNGFPESGPEVQRPSTASDDLDSLDSGSGSDSPRADVVGPVKYEETSGLRWNRVVPGKTDTFRSPGSALILIILAAFNLLRNAGYEAQQPQGDSRLARSLYISALMYLLDALPPDLTTEETRLLENRLPAPIKANLASYPQSQLGRLEGVYQVKPSTADRSYLHKLLASVIVQFFILIRIILPYARLFMCRIYEYERSHRITERVVSVTLEAADGLGQRSGDITSAVGKFHDGRIGTLIRSFASWWIEGIAGGIYEGVGEGIVHLGFLKPDLEIDRVAIK